MRFVRHPGACGIRHPRIFTYRPKVNGNRSALSGKTNGVLKEVGDQLNHSVRVAFDQQRLSLDVGKQPQRFFPGLRADFQHHIVDQISKITTLNLILDDDGLQPGEI